VRQILEFLLCATFWQKNLDLSYGFVRKKICTLMIEINIYAKIFPKVSDKFFSGRSVALDSTQPLTEMNTWG
jgi:hypothetical protein